MDASTCLWLDLEAVLLNLISWNHVDIYVQDVNTHVQIRVLSFFILLPPPGYFLGACSLSGSQGFWAELKVPLAVTFQASE